MDITGSNWCRRCTGMMCIFHGTVGLLVLTGHWLNTTVYLSAVADHLHHFDVMLHSLFDSVFYITQLKSPQIFFLNMAVSSFYSIGATPETSTVTSFRSIRVPLVCGGKGMNQECAGMLSYLCGYKSPRNVSISLITSTRWRFKEFLSANRRFSREKVPCCGSQSPRWSDTTYGTGRNANAIRQSYAYHQLRSCTTLSSLIIHPTTARRGACSNGEEQKGWLRTEWSLESGSGGRNQGEQVYTREKESERWWICLRKVNSTEWVSRVGVQKCKSE